MYNSMVLCGRLTGYHANSSRERIPRIHTEFPLSSLTSRLHLTRNFIRLIVSLASENLTWKDLISVVKSIQRGRWFPREIKLRQTAQVSVVTELSLLTPCLKKYTPRLPCRYLNMWRKQFPTNFSFLLHLVKCLTLRQVAWVSVRRQDRSSKDNHHCRHKVCGHRDDN